MHTRDQHACAYARPTCACACEAVTTLTIFCDFSVKPSSRYSLDRAPFASPVFQKCSDPVNFFRFLCEIELSLYSPVHFLSTTFADRSPQPRKQRPYFGDHGSHFTRKNTGRLIYSAFKPEFTRSRPNDVVDMVT